jgi:hypothetical protein
MAYDQQHQRALEYLYARTGMTEARLIEVIERYQPVGGGRPVNSLGLGPELMGMMVVHLPALGEQEWPAVCRAVGHLASAKPWLTATRGFV